MTSTCSWLDVLLLADLFEKFRTTCLEYYILFRYIITPLLVLPGMQLLESRVDLQLITDNSIRGGISSQ